MVWEVRSTESVRIRCPRYSRDRLSHSGWYRGTCRGGRLSRLTNLSLNSQMLSSRCSRISSPSLRNYSSTQHKEERTSIDRLSKWDLVHYYQKETLHLQRISDPQALAHHPGMTKLHRWLERQEVIIPMTKSFLPEVVNKLVALAPSKPLKMSTASLEQSKANL